MPTLNANGELFNDAWFVSEAAEQDNQANALVPAERWNEQPGLFLAVDAEPTAQQTTAQCIGIHFPAFNDGRGLSLAVLLRERLGYAGHLRAYGDVHPDMLHYLRRCGFDSFELPGNRSVDTAIAALKPYAAYYQSSVIEPEPKFRR